MTSDGASDPRNAATELPSLAELLEPTLAELQNDAVDIKILELLSKTLLKQLSAEYIAKLSQEDAASLYRHALDVDKAIGTPFMFRTGKRGGKASCLQRNQLDALLKSMANVELQGSKSNRRLQEYHDALESAAPAVFRKYNIPP